jgi:UDP-3-O-[3-hydroxymyristoyl] glucosamine N-acyltransferase
MYSIENIREYLGVKHTLSNGSSSKFSFSNVKTIFEADDNSLCWLNPTRSDKEVLLTKTNARIIICNFDEKLDVNFTEKLFIKVENPKLVYLRIVRALFTPRVSAEISPCAHISPKAVIGKNVSIGPNVVIGECIIGDNAVIGSNCVLHDKTVLGSNTLIKAGSVVGGEGFGYAKNENGKFEKFPHIGGVIIEDEVEIGSNTCIDRGTLGNTVIRRGAKIDNLVHIAHNVDLGENSFVIANSMIAGSTIIGENTWIAPSVSVRDAIEIGSNSVIGMASLVMKNIPDNEIWVGFPARKIRSNEE